MSVDMVEFNIVAKMAMGVLEIDTTVLAMATKISKAFKEVIWDEFGVDLDKVEGSRDKPLHVHEFCRCDTCKHRYNELCDYAECECCYVEVSK